VAGCCILVATMRRLHLAEITVSTRGLLDGVAHRVRLNS
jgi:exopolyphosphatase/pppGpp-phosphohydrolase